MIYEYRAYYVVPGRMPDLQDRFAKHTLPLFKKHGIRVVGFRRRVSIAFTVTDNEVWILGIYYGGRNFGPLQFDDDDDSEP